MAESQDLKVFISWSGERSRAVALAIRSWLPLLFDNVAPWMSEADISAGQRGLAKIEEELRNTRFGIIVVTADNQDSPWLHFEAGALSRVVADRTEHRVTPLLIDLTGPSQLTGPLTQFQAKAATRDGVRDLLRSLAEVVGIAAETIEKRFDVYWPKLEVAIADRLNSKPLAKDQTIRRRSADDMLDEILEHVRDLRISNAPVAVPGVTRSEWDRITEGIRAVAELMTIEIDGFTLHGPDASGLAVFVSLATTPDQFDQFGVRLSQVIGRPVIVSYAPTTPTS